MFGGAGNDYLETGVLTSVLDAGSGDDTLIVRMSGGGDHVLSGGAGLDTFTLIDAADTSVSDVTITDFSLGQDSLSIDGIAIGAVMNANIGLEVVADGTRITLTSGDSITLQGVTAEQLYVAFGLAGNDALLGDNNDNRLFAGQGANSIDGQGGHDLIGGGGGSDTLMGGVGNDTLAGLNGADFLDGGAGDDVIYAHAGNDTLNGNDGDDALYSGTGSSLLYGGNGDDFLQSRMEKGRLQFLTGGADSDTFDFNLAANRKAALVTVTDFDAADDHFTINGTVAYTYYTNNELAFTDTDAGALLVLACGQGSILFQGRSADDMITAMLADAGFLVPS